MNPADRNLVPTTVLPAGSRAQSLTAIDLSGWKRVGLFPSVVNSKVTRIGGRALAIVSVILVLRRATHCLCLNVYLAI